MKKSKTDVVYTIPGIEHSRRCVGQHFGAWAIDPDWFASAISALNAGTLKASAGDEDERDKKYAIQQGVAIIPIEGMMTKHGSSFGGGSTIRARQQIRDAVADPAVNSLMLHISSPGGTVFGTADLADEVGQAKASKPVLAYVSDQACSAAYWVASQCNAIYAGRTAQIGSIGTFTVLTDKTKANDQIGFTYTVVSSGKYKGLGADGKVTPDLVADVQRQIDEVNASFLEAVQSGRGKKISDLAAVSDGRVYIAKKAQTLGLIDKIASFDQALDFAQQLNNEPAFAASSGLTGDAVVLTMAAPEKTGDANMALLEQLRELFGAADLTEEQVMAKVTALSQSTESLTAELDKAKKNVIALSAEPPKPNPQVVKLIAKNARMAKNAALKAGGISAHAAEELEKLLIGTGDNYALSLSQEVPGTEDVLAERVFAILAENKPIALGGITGSQALPNAAGQQEKKPSIMDELEERAKSRK